MREGLFLIWARAANGTIGKDGTLPWRISADLRRFKAMTMGKPMIMGRKTFESFAKPLPGRRHIVLTRDIDWRAEGAEVAHSVEDALALAGEGEVAVIGGAETYATLMPHAARIEATEIAADYEGDTHLPAPGPEWVETARETIPATCDDPETAFVTYERRKP